MPSSYRQGLAFISDSQEFTSLEQMLADFEAWGKAFAPAPVGFQFGYPADGAWWRKLADPPAAIGKAILARIPNTSDLYLGRFYHGRNLAAHGRALRTNNKQTGNATAICQQKPSLRYSIIMKKIIAAMVCLLFGLAAVAPGHKKK